MADFEIGIALQPEAGGSKAFESEARAIAGRVEPIIQKAFTIDDATAKRLLAPFDKEAKRIAKGISVGVTVAADSKSISRAQSDIQKAFNKSPVTQQIKVVTENTVKGAKGQLVPKVDTSIAPNLDKINSSMGRLGNSTNTTTSSFLKFATGVLGLGGAIGGISALFGSALSAGTQLDTQLRALDNLTGVLGSSAADSFTKIQLEANKLPGTFSDVESGVIQLSSVLGFNLNQSLKAFEQLTGAALASGKGLGNVNGAVAQLGQVAAKGKLQLEELSTIAENIPGIKVADVIHKIAVAMNVTDDAAHSLLSNGLVPAKVGIQAILDVAKDVPGAQEAIANSATSLEATFSTLKDALNVGLAKAFLTAVNAAGGADKAFGGLAPVVTGLTTKLVPLFTAFVQLVPALSSSLSLFNALLAPVNLLTKVLAFLGPALTPIITGFVAFKTFKTVVATLNVVLAGLIAKAEGASASAATASAALATQNKVVIALRAAMQQLTNINQKYAVSALEAAAASGDQAAALKLEAKAAEEAAVANDLNSKGPKVSLPSKISGAGSKAKSGLGKLFGKSGAAGDAEAIAAEAAATEEAAGATSAFTASTLALPAVGAAVGLLTAGWQIHNQAVAKAKENAQAYIDVVTKAHTTDDIDARIAAYKEEARVAQQRADDAKRHGGIAEFIFGGKEEQHKQERDFFKQAAIDAQNQKDFLTRFGADTGLSYAEAQNAAAAQGIDFTEIDNILKTKGRAGVEAYLQAAEDAWRNSGAVQQTNKAAEDALTKGFSTLDSLNNASKAVTSANKAVKDATQEESAAVAKVNELYAKKKKILADTTSESRELAAANRDIAKSDIALRELQEEQKQLPKELAALQDKQTLAGIKYTQAVRDQEEAVAKLNGRNKAGLGINLAGLNQAQIKTAVANARLAGTENDKESPAVAEAKLQEDVVTKTIAVRDAKRDQEGIDNEIRDKNERISDITGDIQEAQEKTTEATEKRDELLKGNTTHAKELKDVDTDIAAANKEAASASERKQMAEEAARDAAWDYRKAVLTATDDHKGLLALLIEEEKHAPKGVQAAAKPDIGKATTAVGDEGKATGAAAANPPPTPEQEHAKILGIERDDKKQLFFDRLLKAGIITNQEEFNRIIVGQSPSFQGFLDSILRDTLTNKNSDVFKNFEEKTHEQEIIRDLLLKFGASAAEALSVLNDEDFSKNILSQVTDKDFKDPNTIVRNKLREVVRRLGFLGHLLPGFKAGGLVGLDKTAKGGQLIIAGEDSKEELILPLRGSKERALTLLSQAIKFADPGVAGLLKRAIGVKGFKSGGIVGGQATGAVVTGVPTKDNPLAPIDEKLDAVGSDVDAGFDDVEGSLDTQSAQINRLFAISRALTKTLVGQQSQLVTLNAAVIDLNTAVTVSIPGQIDQIVANSVNDRATITSILGTLDTVSTKVDGFITSFSSALNGQAVDISGFNEKNVAQSVVIDTIKDRVNELIRLYNTVVVDNFTKVSNFQQSIAKGLILVAKTLGVEIAADDVGTTGPGSDLVKDMSRFVHLIARSHAIPGAASGAVITGTPGAYGQLLRVGEYNRPEAVVSLTNKEDMLRVLKNSIPYAAPGVRSVLTGILDEGMGRHGAILDLGSGPSVNVVGGGSRKDQTEMAVAVGNVIADRLIAAGVGNNGGPISITLEGSDYNEVNAKKLMREIERKRNRF